MFFLPTYKPTTHRSKNNLRIPKPINADATRLTKIAKMTPPISQAGFADSSSALTSPAFFNIIPARLRIQVYRNLIADTCRLEPILWPESGLYFKTLGLPTAALVSRQMRAELEAELPLTKKKPEYTHADMNDKPVIICHMSQLNSADESTDRPLRVLIKILNRAVELDKLWLETNKPSENALVGEAVIDQLLNEFDVHVAHRDDPPEWSHLYNVRSVHYVERLSVNDPVMTANLRMYLQDVIPRLRIHKTLDLRLLNRDPTGKVRSLRSRL